MGCFVVAEFLLTSVSRGPSAIAEPLVVPAITAEADNLHAQVPARSTPQQEDSVDSASKMSSQLTVGPPSTKHPCFTSLCASYDSRRLSSQQDQPQKVHLLATTSMLCRVVRFRTGRKWTTNSRHCILCLRNTFVCQLG